MRTIVREAKKYDTIINYVAKERLNQMSETGKHQGVIAYAAAYEYAEVEDMLKLAEEKANRHFYSFLTGSRILTIWELSSVLPIWLVHMGSLSKRRAVGLTATVAKTSAGALNYTPVAKVTNLTATMEDLKKRGLWFVCADMGGDVMYKMNLTGLLDL